MLLRRIVEFVFYSILFFTSSTSMAGEEVLINGRPVSPGEYPEVVRIKSCESGRGCASCSASVVGDRVVLTAGHCLLGDGKIEYMIDQTSFKAQCTAHPLYPKIEDMDMALCISDKPMDVKYAQVSKTGPEIGDKVTLIGYGCIDSKGQGGNDGILRVGRSEVYRLPKLNPVDNWYWTKDDSALCFGDSGGPSFKLVGDAESETHYVMGVNSRGNIKDTSLLTAIYIDKGVKFMTEFESEHNVQICGLSRDCAESSPTDPEGPRDIPRKCRRIKRKLDKYQRKLEKYELKYDQCLDDEEVRFIFLDTNLIPA